MSPSEIHQEDLELVRDVLAGRADACDDFCRRMRCVARILSARNRRWGRPLDDHDLADLAQETALAVWRRLDSYAGRASLETWVYRFCALTMRNALRKRNASPSRLSELGQEGWLEPELGREEPPAAEEEAELDALLRHLSPREAEVLRLRHVDGLGNREIGELLDISINSVKTHSLHAMAKLRELFRAGTPKEA